MELREASPCARRQRALVLAGMQARLSSQLLPFRDPNGFRKLIFLLTKPGGTLSLSWALGYYFSGPQTWLSPT